jgi:small multidrug resistance pump
MAYVVLVLAIAVEVVGASLLKASEGFSRLWPSLGSLAAYVVAFVLLAQVIRRLPVGMVYAMWAGLGTVAIVAIGAAFLGEPLSPVKAVGIALVIAGVVMLNLGGAH